MFKNTSLGSKKLLVISVIQPETQWMTNFQEVQKNLRTGIFHVVQVSIPKLLVTSKI